MPAPLFLAHALPFSGRRSARIMFRCTFALRALVIINIYVFGHQSRRFFYPPLAKPVPRAVSRMSKYYLVPSDYRTTCEAAWNGIIVSGQSSGRISFLKVKEGQSLNKNSVLIHFIIRRLRIHRRPRLGFRASPIRCNHANACDFQMSNHT